MRKRFLFTGILLTISMSLQLIISIVFYNYFQIDWLSNSGWVILWISGIFGISPIFTFRKHGKVYPKSSYMNTNRFVKNGLYRIIRHPQYLAGMMIGFGLILISQHWAGIGLGIVNIILCAKSGLDEEISLSQKFGKDYEAYMVKVPRFNFILGIFRILKNKLDKHQ